MVIKPQVGLRTGKSLRNKLKWLFIIERKNLWKPPIINLFNEPPILQLGMERVVLRYGEPPVWVPSTFGSLLTYITLTRNFSRFP